VSLDGAIATGGSSVCLSVRPSVYHTREQRLNGSRYRNTLCIYARAMCLFAWGQISWSRL